MKFRIFLVILLAVVFVSGAAFARGQAAGEPLPGPPPPQWIAQAAAFTPMPGKRMIAVVIDDMGLDQARSRRAVALPPEVTLAYLPYGRDMKKQTEEARAAGHELLVHVPMEPLGAANPGPDCLKTGAAAEEIRGRLLRDLGVFEGYVGINNHMGSKFTQDRAGMELVMQELKERGLLFLDSKTISTSVGEEAALAAGVPTTRRDVFLDDEETEAFTENALKKAEDYARRHGTAVAIGHPKDITLRDLEAWIPTLAEKGIELAPLTAVLQARMKGDARVQVARACMIN